MASESILPASGSILPVLPVKRGIIAEPMGSNHSGILIKNADSSSMPGGGSILAAGVPLSPTQPQRGTPGPWDGSPAASTPPDAPIQAQGSGWGPQSQRKTANGDSGRNLKRRLTGNMSPSSSGDEYAKVIDTARDMLPAESSPRSSESGRLAFRDFLWRVLTSYWWAGAQVFIGIIVAILHTISWVLWEGPGLHCHNEGPGHVLSGVLSIFVIASLAAYHWEARRRLTGLQKVPHILLLPLVQSLAWRLLQFELITFACWVVCSFGLLGPVVAASPNNDASWAPNHGPHRSYLYEATMIIDLIPGFNASRMVVLTMSCFNFGHVYVSKHKVADSHDPHWLANLMMICMGPFIILVLSIVVMLTGILGSIINVQDGGFHRYYIAVEARHLTEYAIRYCGHVPCTVDRLMTALSSNMDITAKLIAIHLNDLGSFPPVVWESDDFLDGRTARILFIQEGDNIMYFDLDDIFFSSRVLDILLLVFILFLSAVSASITHYVLRWYMVRPSESICHALKSCAAWIDDDGSLIRGGGSSQLTMGPASARTPTVARSKVLPEAYSTTSLWSKGASGDAKEPVTLVRAMQRFLAHLQASMRLHDTGLHLPGLKATHEGQPDTRPGTVAPEEGSDGESSTMGRWRGGALQRGLSQPDKRASTRFDPKVINRMGSMAWSALDMGEEVLVAACHAIFMKARIPTSICKRETFVVWASHLLSKHPRHAFHSSMHAVETFHAVYCTLKLPELQRLCPIRRFALLIAALGMNVGSRGVSNGELRKRRDPLWASHPGGSQQQKESAAVVMRTALETPDANIFELLSDDDLDSLQGMVTGALEGTAPENEERLAKMLTLLQNRLDVATAGKHFDRESEIRAYRAKLLSQADINLLASAVLKYADFAFCMGSTWSACQWWSMHAHQALGRSEDATSSRTLTLGREETRSQTEAVEANRETLERCSKVINVLKDILPIEWDAKRASQSLQWPGLSGVGRAAAQVESEKKRNSSESTQGQAVQE